MVTTISQLPFDRIVEQLNDGILIVSFEGDIIYVNLQMSAILGYTADEMIGQTLFDFMSDAWADRARDNLKRREAGVEERFDHQFLHKDGSNIWAMVSTRPITLDDGTRLSLVAIRDITSRMEMEEALRAIKAELEERVHERTQALEHEVQTRRQAERLALEESETKSRLLANMSHELRTPLNAIIGYSELIIEDFDSLSAQEVMVDLRRVLASSNHLLHLVNDILDLSRIDAGKEGISPESFDLGRLLDEVVDMIHPLLDEHHNTLQRTTPAGLVVYLDRLKLKQILINVLSNAAHYTQHGTISLRAHLSPDDASSVLIEIQDTGQGIEADEMPHLFQPFVRSSSVSYAQKAGTGLGLAICQRYCELMGGSISAQSAIGHGSTFTITLPTRVSP